MEMMENYVLAGRRRYSDNYFVKEYLTHVFNGQQTYWNVDYRYALLLSGEDAQRIADTFKFENITAVRAEKAPPEAGSVRRLIKGNLPEEQTENTTEKSTSDLEKEYYSGGSSFRLDVSLDDPKWEERISINDWRNYVGKRVKSIWHTLSAETRAAIALDADDFAGYEEWD